MRWLNLVNAWRLMNRARWLLAGWELGMWTVMWAAGFILPWWGWAIGAAVAFVAHELVFQPYAERVIGLTEARSIWQEPGYVPTLERWTGPVA